MSKYTTEVRFLCETYAGKTESEGYTSLASILASARTKIFDFSYPIFDTSYKEVLETKILKHFYTREICEETAGLWKLRLDAKMNEIMPYYNKLYESELLQINPLYNVNKTSVDSGNKESNTNESGNTNTVSTGNKTETEDTHSALTGFTDNATTQGGTSKGSNVSNNHATESDKTGSKDRYSDTPQGGISNLENNSYLTNARIIDGTKDGETQSSTVSTDEVKSESEGTSKTRTQDLTQGNRNKGEQSANVTNLTNGKEGKSATIENYVSKVLGVQGVSESKLLNEYRETFLNIDTMIINELETLFLQLW